MKTLPIPNTKVNAVFIEKPETGFTPIFYNNGPGAGTMLSVNAGNSQGLWVGGGGINLGFSRALQHIQNISAYESRHHKLLDQVQDGGPDFMHYADENPTSFSLAYYHPVNTSPDYYEGLCFVDIFGEDRHPHGIPENAGMLYVATPKGDLYHNETDFLEAIKKTAENIVAAVGRYNSMASQHSVPMVSILRLCLYSSGIYNSFGLSADNIALSIFTGLRTSLENKNSSLTDIEFPYSDDKTDPLFAAVMTLLST